MTRLSTAMTAAMAAIGPTWGTAQVEGVHQIVKALREKLVNLIDHPTQLSALKVALHQVNHVIDQHVTLRLHDVGGRGAYEQHHEIIA